MARWVRCLFLSFVVLAAVAGCGGADARYVENQAEALYLKLPEQWSTYDAGELLRQDLPAGDTFIDALRRQRETPWIVGFAAEPVNDPVSVTSLASIEPQGYSAILVLDPESRDAFDLVALRSLGWPLLVDGSTMDPVQFMEDNPDGPVEVFVSEEIQVPGRGAGVHQVVGIDLPDVPETMMREVLAITDDLRTRVYVLSIGCIAKCFLEDHVDEIRDVVNSFTLEEQ